MLTQTAELSENENTDSKLSLNHIRKVHTYRNSSELPVIVANSPYQVRTGLICNILQLISYCSRNLSFCSTSDGGGFDGSFQERHYAYILQKQCICTYTDLHTTECCISLSFLFASYFESARWRCIDKKWARHYH